jgi:hypothetical protein
VPIKKRIFGCSKLGRQMKLKHNFLSVLRISVGIDGDLMDKKDNNTSYLLLGIILIIYSIVSFFSWLQGNVYPFLVSLNVTEIMLVVLGLFAIKKMFRSKEEGKMANFFVAICLIVFGALPIALQLGLSKILPFTLELKPSFPILTMLMFFGSVYFVVDQYLAISRNKYSKST